MKLTSWSWLQSLLASIVFLAMLGPSATLWSQETAVAEAAEEEESSEEAEVDGIQQPFLWKFTPENGASQYLLGTIHVPDNRILKLHPAIDEAMSEAKVLFVELAPADQVSQLQNLTFAPGTRLSDKLDAETIKRIDAQLNSMREGLSSANLPAFKIWAWPLILPNLEAQLSGDGRPVLDMLLVEKATANDWPVRSLEKVDTQLSGFDKLSVEEQTTFLKASLDSMEEDEEEGEDAMEELMTIYMQGDGEVLSEKFHEEFFDESIPKELAEKIFGAIMVDRNKVMADTIEATLKESPETTHIFAAGAGHYVVGPTVVELLIERGYKFERVEVESAED